MRLIKVAIIFLMWMAALSPDVSGQEKLGPIRIMPDGEKIAVPTSSGEVEVRNFSKHSAQKMIQEAAVFIVIVETKDYLLQYDSCPNNDCGYEFVVFPKVQPLAVSIPKGEAAFLKELDISREEACKLTVRIGIADYVDHEYAGSNYGLSFCPDNNPFPLRSLSTSSKRRATRSRARRRQ